MAAINEPDPSQYDAEYRCRFEAVDPAGTHVVVQGSVNFFKLAPSSPILVGNADETKDNTYDVRLLVGPYWKDVKSVVPSVTINGFLNKNADEDDQQKWEIKDLTWDTVGEFGPNQDELRIRLKFIVHVRGENSIVLRLGYYLIARGRNLGDGGLNAPGPVKPQG